MLAGVEKLLLVSRCARALEGSLCPQVGRFGSGTWRNKDKPAGAYQRAQDERQQERLPAANPAQDHTGQQDRRQAQGSRA